MQCSREVELVAEESCGGVMGRNPGFLNLHFEKNSNDWLKHPQSGKRCGMRANDDWAICVKINSLSQSVYDST